MSSAATAPSNLVPGDDAKPDLYLSRLPESRLGDFKPNPEALITNSTFENPSDASVALWKELNKFKCVNDDYAVKKKCTYVNAFNWNKIELPKEIEAEWFAVAFRSTRNERNPPEESAKLYQVDRDAHEEAVQNGGILMYWYGVPDASGQNLATCIWETAQQAANARNKPNHSRAIELAKNAYSEFVLERYSIVKKEGKTKVEIHEIVQAPPEK